MKYRSRTDIIQILLTSAAKGDMTKTHLMYSAYLSHPQATEYLAFMMEKQLLTYDEKMRVYAVTDKGQRFIRTYAEISELMSLPKPLTRMFQQEKE